MDGCRVCKTFYYRGTGYPYSEYTEISYRVDTDIVIFDFSASWNRRKHLDDLLSVSYLRPVSEILRTRSPKISNQTTSSYIFSLNRTRHIAKGERPACTAQYLRQTRRPGFGDRRRRRRGKTRQGVKESRSRIARMIFYQHHTATVAQRSALHCIALHYIPSFTCK